MRRMIAFNIGLFVSLALSSPAQTQDNTIGSSFGFTVALGSQGSFSFVEFGVVLPRMGDSFTMGIRIRAMSSLNWVPILDRDMDPAAFHPVIIGGIVTLGGSSPLIHDAFRMYGASEILLGYTFTPYDSAIHGLPNLIGENLTFAVMGHFGMEVFTAPTLSVFLDCGGGFKNYFVEESRKTDPYVIAASWLGSGFGIRMGTRFYM